MEHSAVESYVDRSLAVLEARPPRTRSETARWLVDPLLVELGWDPAGSASIRLEDPGPDHPADRRYTIAGRPALLVAIEPASGELAEDRARALQRVAGAEGAPRALALNGRAVGVVVGPTDPTQIPVEELTDAIPLLETLTVAAVRSTLHRDAAARAASAIEADRATLETEIANRLTAVAGEAIEPELAAATERFLDTLIDRLSAEGDGSPADRSGPTVEPGRPDGSVDRATRSADRGASPPVDDSAPDVGREPTKRATLDEPSSEVGAEQVTPTDVDVAEASVADEVLVSDDGVTTDAGPADVVPPEESVADAETESNGEPAPRSSTGEAPERTDQAGESPAGTDASDGPDGTADDVPAVGERGEYVAKFFALEGGTVGAIGDARASTALVAAVEYLYERGLRTVGLPWSPEEDGPTILNRAPERDDGTPMDNPVELSNGYYLDVPSTTRGCALVLEALAERAGLRVMLAGDWSDSEK